MSEFTVPEVAPPEVIRRREAAAASGHTGEESEARHFLTDPDGGVRAAAYQALARMKSLSEDDVSTALTDADAVVRRRACALAIPTDLDLIPLLHDTDLSVVEQAAWALGERAEAAGIEAVAALSTVVISHDDALCREAAVAALGAIGDEAGLPAILHATKDKPAIRRRAVIALAPFDGHLVDGALERAKTDRDWQVRQAAEDLSD